MAAEVGVGALDEDPVAGRAEGLRGSDTAWNLASRPTGRQAWAPFPLE